MTQPNLYHGGSVTLTKTLSMSFKIRILSYSDSQVAPLQLIHGANVNFTLLHVAFNCSTFLVRVVLATNVKKCVRRSVDETRKREHEGAAPGVKQGIIALRA